MNQGNDRSGNGQGVDDDSYVLEDTGESLEDFEVEDVTGDVAASPSAGGAADAPAAYPQDDFQLENQRLKDQLLRRMADFENFRKRSEREKSDYRKHALAELVRELVPVLDNFERALASAGGEVSSDFRTGVEMISKQLQDVLQRGGVRAIGEAQVPFDPTIHEAVMSEPNPSVPANTVLEVLQKGYFLNDRLIRPAMVKVSVGGSDNAAESSS